LPSERSRWTRGDTEAELHERIKKAEREQIVELLRNADIVNGKAVFNVN